MSNKQHKMIAGGYGHGLSHCEYCLATDREIAFVFGPVCPRAPETPAPDAGGLVERLTIDDTIRFMENACRNWENFAINHDDADDMRVALEAFRKTAITTLTAKAQADAAEIDRLRRRWDMVDQLRASEGHSVEIIHDNGDFGGPNCAVRTTVNFGVDYAVFYGETVDACLEAAVAALGEQP